MATLKQCDRCMKISKGMQVADVLVERPASGRVTKELCNDCVTMLLEFLAPRLQAQEPK